MSKRSINGAFLDVAAAALLIGCTERTLRAHIARHTIPFRRLGARIVFRRTELEEFLDALPGVSLREAQTNVALRSGEAVYR
jgi:excisionase family DNA binding protein